MSVYGQQTHSSRGSACLRSRARIHPVA